MDKQSSDERLLKLIEGSSGSGPAQGRRPPAAAGRKKSPFNLIPAKFNLSGLGAMLSAVKVNLSDINRGLIGLGILLTLIFFYSLLSGPAVSKSNAAYFMPNDASALTKVLSIGQEQGLMRKTINSADFKRNLFFPASGLAEGSAQDAGPDLSEVVKELKLVGIIWSKDPEVMIENAKDARTYTLKKGDVFVEKFKIKNISRESATLEVNTGFGAKEYELR